MTEPSTTISTSTAGAGISLSFTLMGADVQALIVGLVAAVLMSFWLPSVDQRGKACASIMFSALASGYGAAAAAAVAADNLPMVPRGEQLNMLMAVVIGALLPVLMPAIIKRAKRWIGGGAE